MKKILTIRKVGSSLRLTISEIARELGLGEGDKVHVVRTPKGFELVPYDADFGKSMKTARGFIQKYPKAMKTLSK
jgi:bifunctional DNA-binding transcriptional regulator/antitoxin component of YhaV-PrlF toxin-antitoxin module